MNSNIEFQENHEYEDEGSTGNQHLFHLLKELFEKELHQMTIKLWNKMMELP